MWRICIVSVLLALLSGQVQCKFMGRDSTKQKSMFCSTSFALRVKIMHAIYVRICVM